MTDFYSIKFNNGDQGFEVQGPNQDWVEGKAEKMHALLDTNPAPRTSGINKIQKASRKLSSSKSTFKKQGTANVSQIAEVWSEDLPAQLTEFVKERQKSFDQNTPQQAAIIAVYFKDTLDIESVTPNNLNMIYRQMGWKTINHEGQLKNAYQRNKYFSLEDGAYTLTYAGIQYGRDGSKVTKSKK